MAPWTPGSPPGFVCAGPPRWRAAHGPDPPYGHPRPASRSPGVVEELGHVHVLLGDPALLVARQPDLHLVVADADFRVVELLVGDLPALGREGDPLQVVVELVYVDDLVAIALPVRRELLFDLVVGEELGHVGYDGRDQVKRGG